ncbi:MAG: hypothetical protein R3237_06385, partial [Nitrosopumilaceae archaeon]|nr:hypothetical protein [Nitrosopumilaceae archaeon]
MSFLKFHKPEVDWPLTSKHIPSKLQQSSVLNHRKFDISNTKSFWNYKTPKLDIIANKKVALSVEKGTKRIIQFLNQINSEENSIRQYSSEKHICDTCDQEIGHNISRTLLMRDKDEGPRLLCFHFFYPCWDFKLLVQKYP